MRNDLIEAALIKLLKAVKKLVTKKDELPLCSAVIVAAGSSMRMGEDKTLMELGGVPVLVRTLRAFNDCDSINEIVVVTKAEKLEYIAHLCKLYYITKVTKVVCGGATRMESSLAGVCACRPMAELVAVHDAARPFVTEELISRTVEAAAKYNAAAPAIASTDTLKAVDRKGFVLGTVDRNSTVRIQTPQIFNADLIKGALTRAVEKQLPLTDDCAAMEMMGVKTMIVEGDENNIKLTTPKDLQLAASIIKSRGEKL